MNLKKKKKKKKGKGERGEEKRGGKKGAHGATSLARFNDRWISFTKRQRPMMDSVGKGKGEKKKAEGEGGNEQGGKMDPVVGLSPDKAVPKKEGKKKWRQPSTGGYQQKGKKKKKEKSGARLFP